MEQTGEVGTGAAANFQTPVYIIRGRRAAEDGWLWGGARPGKPFTSAIFIITHTSGWDVSVIKR